MNLSTTSYQTETPAFLWEPWKKGPADEYDRCCLRLQSLIAADVLANCPDRLNDEEQRLAREMAADVQEVVDDGR